MEFQRFCVVHEAVQMRYRVLIEISSVDPLRISKGCSTFTLYFIVGLFFFLSRLLLLSRAPQASLWTVSLLGFLLYF